MEPYFDIEKAIQATEGYDAYQRIFMRWARITLLTRGSNPLTSLADYVRINHPDVYHRALAYARVMGEV